MWHCHIVTLTLSLCGNWSMSIALDEGDTTIDRTHSTSFQEWFWVFTNLLEPRSICKGNITIYSDLHCTTMPSLNLRLHANISVVDPDGWFDPVEWHSSGVGYWGQFEMETMRNGCDVSLELSDGHGCCSVKSDKIVMLPYRLTVVPTSCKNSESLLEWGWMCPINGGITFIQCNGHGTKLPPKLSVRVTIWQCHI